MHSGKAGMASNQSNDKWQTDDKSNQLGEKQKRGIYEPKRGAVEDSSLTCPWHDKGCRREARAWDKVEEGVADRLARAVAEDVDGRDMEEKVE